MKKHFTCSIAALFSCAALALYGGDFELKTNGTVNFQGQTLVKSTGFTCGSTELLEGKSGKMEKLADGSTVINRESRSGVPYREEIAVNGDGSEVEITFSMRVESDHEAVRSRQPLIYAVKLPWNVFANKNYKGVVGRVSSVKISEGACNTDFASGYKNMRSIVLTGSDPDDGLVLDFNPIGFADYISDYSGNCVRGIWSVTRVGDEIHCTVGISPDPYGAEFTGKIKIVRGNFATYRRRHALTRYNWGDPFDPQYLFSFGSGKTGKNYTAVNDGKFDSRKNYGWVSQTLPRSVAGYKEGVFYNAMQGKDGKFRIADLPAGWYMVTVGAGNYSGVENNFSVKANGQTLLEKGTVDKGRAVTGSRTVWVKDTLDIELDGNYLISSIGVQMLLADAEDVNVRRDFYRTRGFEPSVVFRNGLYALPAEFPAAREEFVLPVPGQETARSYREPQRRVQVLDAEKYSGADWRYDAVICNYGPNNSGTLGDYPSDSELNRHLSNLKSRNASVVISNGMLSRHTYYAHLPRAEKAIKRLTENAHQHGLKVMDHQDLTLLWNIDAGFRAAGERIGQLQRMNINQLPTPYFCFMKKDFREQYFDYMKNFVRNTNVDAMMLDEVMFFKYCCTCSTCRAEFYKDTNWYLPVNELDKRMNNDNDPLWRAFLNWRKVQVGNFFADLRKAIDEVKPDFSLVAYTTHYGYYSRYASFGNGSDLIEIARGADFLGTEITTRNQWRGARAVFALRKAKNLLRIAYNVPVWALCGTNGSSYEVLYTGWALSNMNGQGVWVNDSSRPKPGQGDFFKLPENMDIKNSESAAQVALLFSSRGRDWGSGLSATSEILGTGQVLDTMQIPYDFIGEMSLNGQQLAKYKLLIIGSCSALTDEEIAAIKEFMRNGGWVCASTTVGWENGLGARRKEWPFIDVLGCDVNRRSIATPSTITDPANGQEITLKHKFYYVHPDYSKTAPRPKESRLWARNNKNQRYPLVVERNYGQGKFIYQTNSMGLHLCAGEGYVNKPWDFDPDKNLERIFADYLKQLVIDADAACWQTNLPEGVLATVYKNAKAKRWTIHLLNVRNNHLNKGDIVKFGVTPDAFPQLANDAEIKLYDMKNVKKVYAVSADFAGRRELEFKVGSDGTLTLVMPKELLKIYTLIHIACGE